MEFGVYMRKGVISSTIRSCCRSVCKYPFLVFIMCASIYMSRSHPYMLSLLISTSPVIVCTAVLLGTLLVSGQRNTAETEQEKRARYEAIARKNGMLYDGNADGQDEMCFVERCSKSKRDDVEIVNKLAGIRVGGGGGVLSKVRKSVRFETESIEKREATRELEDDALQKQKSEWNEERVDDGEGMVDHYAIISKVIGELLESESDHDNKSEEDDCSHSGSGSDSEVSWKKNKEGDNGSDSESNRAESSSPDASEDDTMPMLDELHPLLDEDTAHPIQLSCVGSAAASTDQSPRSSISSSIESGEETEVHGSEDGDDDEAKTDKTKAVITWTEEDQKNLVDVGSSEIERNQWLERILRRRKNMSMVPEINFIESENSEFQLNIAPISTSRRNPFDLPHDDYESSAPGSAPSILLPRRNPFDLPYDDDDQEETVDEPHEELRLPSLTRQPFLRRRDNFLARPSIFAPKGEERQPSRFRPFFIPEHTVSEESRFSSFQEQSCGVNSGHETESVSSVEYSEDQTVEEGDVPHQGVDSIESSDCATAKQTQDEAPTSSSHCNDHEAPNARVELLERTRSMQKLTIPDFHELDHDIMTSCSAQVTSVKKSESTAPDHPEQGIVDSVEVEAEKD